MNATELKRQADYSRNLWVAVIARAVEDACAIATTHLPQVEVDKARHWFVRAGKDYRSVCEMANVCPERTRQHVLDFIAKVDADPTARSILSSNGGVEYQGKLYSIDGLAKLKGISPARLRERLRTGMDVERAVLPDAGRAKIEHRSITINGQTRTIKQWAEINGLAVHVALHRLRNGWPAERAVTEPKGLNSWIGQAKAKAARKANRKTVEDSFDHAST